MKISVITPFPDTIDSIMNNSILKKAQEKKIISYRTLNLFDYADSPHKNIDDYPFGGGTGMVMKPEPIFRAYDELKSDPDFCNERVIYPTPDGVLLNHDLSKELSQCFWFRSIEETSCKISS